MRISNQGLQRQYLPLKRQEQQKLNCPQDISYKQEIIYGHCHLEVNVMTTFRLIAK